MDIMFCLSSLSFNNKYVNDEEKYERKYGNRLANKCQMIVLCVRYQ